MKSLSKLKIAFVMATMALVWFPFYSSNTNNFAQEVNGPSIKLAAIKTEGYVPRKVVIPSVDIDIEVKPGSATNNIWTLYTDSAAFLTTSSLLNATGNTVIYGHNSSKVFGPIHNLQKGDKIHVMADGTQLTYSVVVTKIVPPTEISIVEPTRDETLTLFTCTSFADADRFVVIAKRSRGFAEIM